MHTRAPVRPRTTSDPAPAARNAPPARPAHPAEQVATAPHHASPTLTTATTTTPAAAAPTTVAAAPPPADPATTTTPTSPSGPPAPPAIGTVSSYAQSPGFGGPLELALDGSGAVNAYFGELTTLRCHRVRDGVELSVDTCDKSLLTAGAQVARAEHAVNGSGHDVWNVVELIIPS